MDEWIRFLIALTPIVLILCVFAFAAGAYVRWQERKEVENFNVKLKPVQPPAPEAIAADPGEPGYVKYQRKVTFVLLSFAAVTLAILFWFGNLPKSTQDRTVSAIAYTGLAAALAVFAYFWLRVNLPKDEERIFDYVNQRDNLKIAVKLKVICPGANSQRVADIVRHQFEMTYAENSEDYRRVADYVRNSLIEELALPKERHNEVKVFLVERSQEVERKRNPRTIVLGDK